jgi:hypothetical protein
LNAAVLKTAVGLALTVGSNPTLSGWDENFSSTAPRSALRPSAAKMQSPDTVGNIFKIGPVRAYPLSSER